MSRIGRLLIVTLIVATGLLGCDPSFTRPKLETRDDLAVTSILDPSFDQQAVQLTKIQDPRPFQGDFEYVQGADVEIGGVPLANRPPDSLDVPSLFPEDANYVTPDLSIVPRETYELTAVTDADSITGVVAVPDTFVGEVRGQRIVWTPSEGAARYQVSVEDAADTDFEFQNDYTVTDTSVLVREDALADSEVDTAQPGEYYVEITAQDPNLTTFLRNETDRAGVEGGYGVFGAQITISGTVEYPGPTSSSSRRAAKQSVGNRASIRFTR